MQAPVNTPITSIHQSTISIEALLKEKLFDIVPAYHSIAVFTDLGISGLSNYLNDHLLSPPKGDTQNQIVEIPICYELNLDLSAVSDHCGLSEEEVIDLHLRRTYRSLFMGFTPGFIYADGLAPRLSCPRRDNPRTKVEGGAVGIGGPQTGIYALNSPGGWNIIGRTPVKLFDLEKDPPVKVAIGDHFRFTRISLKEFEEWGS